MATVDAITATVDVAYTDLVNEPLSQALADVALAAPADPVALLGRLLLAHADNIKREREVRY